MQKDQTPDLSVALKEWTEIDVAAFHAGVALGIIPASAEGAVTIHLAARNGCSGPKTRSGACCLTCWQKWRARAY